MPHRCSTSKVILTHFTDPRVHTVLPRFSCLLSSCSPHLFPLFYCTHHASSLPHTPAPLALPAILPHCPPPHPLFLSDAFPQKDAGGAHGELHGGSRAELTRHQSQDSSLLPVPLGCSAPYLLYHLFANSPPVPVSQSCASWVGNLHWGWGGIRAVPASPSGLSETGGGASLRL